jgi:transglycosylase-like protein with SLT domain
MALPPLWSLFWPELVSGRSGRVPSWFSARDFLIANSCFRLPMSLKTKIATLLAVGVFGAQASATDVAILRNGFTIRHESRAPLGETTRLFLTADGSSFVDIRTAEIDRIEHDLTPTPTPAPAPEPVATTAPAATVAPIGQSPAVSVPAPITTSSVNVNEVVGAASGRYRLDPDLVNSVIRAESGFKIHAVSPKGAQGLMQLMPGTASKLGVQNAFDPAANVDGGTRYLRELLERYNFDIVKALAAYNAGPQRVEQYKGVPPYRETRLYVASIVRDFNRKKLAQQKAATANQPKPQPHIKARATKSPQQKGTTQSSAPVVAKRTSSPAGD